jgi:CHASE2 domain-containing sensor protein
MNICFDAFISYGRADSKAFATKLHTRLIEQGLKVWFDQNDIPLGVDFQNQIDDGIEKADNFLFIIAPHSVNSQYCRKEIELAIKLNKRIIPLLHVEQISQETWQQRNPKGTPQEWVAYKTEGLHDHFQNMHPTIRKINWVYFREGIDDFEQSFAGLIGLLRRHADYVQQHTQLLVKALYWQRHQKQNSYLLTGEERQQAESWLKREFKDEQSPCTPTDLHCEFISESIKNAHNLMTQVFISYAESDQDFMKKIRRTLLRQGFTVWTNKTDIKIGTEFQEEINKGIEGADNLVWLISPKSLESWYCQQEIAHAFAHNKRIIPLLIEATEVDATSLISHGLSSVQFIDFTNCIDEIKYQKKAAQLLKTLNQDIYYYEQHKTLLVKALKWLQQNRNPSILLRGYNLKQAEAWLKVAKQRTEHPPLSLHEEFITESTKQPPESSLDVFISYSRVDSDFARKLNDALQLQGKTTWFDQESIASGVDFQQEINRGIETANNFVFIISPSSVNSPYCASEVEYVAKLNKRVVTVLYRGVSSQELHPILAGVQWIDYKRHGGDFYANFSELIRTLDTDTEHVRMHTRLLARALEWEREGRDDSFLLRGKDLETSEQWFNQSVHKAPASSKLQTQYLIASLELPYRKPKLRTVLWASVAVAAAVVLMRSGAAILQPLELAAYDLLMRSRPSEQQDQRFLIVEVTDDDLQAQIKRDEEGQGTLRDPSLYRLLTNLQKHEPEVIALDIYRDFPAKGGELQTLLQDYNRLIGVCQFTYESQTVGSNPIKEVKPPHEIPQKQVRDRVGFNNFIGAYREDSLTVRIQPFVASPKQKPDPNCPVDNSLSLMIARRYLEAKGKPYKPPTFAPDGTVTQELQFGTTSIRPMGMFAGGFQDTLDTHIYQTLLNYRSSKESPSYFAKRVTLQDVLDNKLSPEQVKNKIVLIGFTAESAGRDIASTPYGDMPGVIIHAQMVSQIVSAVLDGRPLIWWWSLWGEALWIWVWSGVGGMSIWSFRQLKNGALATGIALVSLSGICYVILAFQSGWIPLVPPAIALVVTAGSVVYITFKLRK